MKYSPHDLLPTKNPKEQIHKNEIDYFYNNVVHHLIPDMVRMVANGIPVDLFKVRELEETVNTVLLTVRNRLANNELMQQFLNERNKDAIANKTNELLSKRKEYTEFISEFNLENMVHRTYVVNTYLKRLGLDKEYYMDKWAIKDLKKVNAILKSTLIQSILDKTLPSNNEIVLEAMENLAKDKANIYNKKYEEKAENLTEEDVAKEFNPNSPVQKQAFFAYLGIESEEQTETGNDKWGREQIEQLLNYVNILIEQEVKNGQ